MHIIFDSFLENMTLIIAFMFLALKLKEYSTIKLKNHASIVWLAALALSLLSLFIMHHPLEYEGIRLDLRGVPLFFISYLAGWKYGLFSIILPIWYRYDLGGPTVIEGIFHSILIPFIIGALFHRREAFNPPHTIIDIKHMMVAFMFYQVARLALILWILPVPFPIATTRIIFESVAVLCIGLMQNDSNRNFLTKKELEFQSRHDTMTNLYNLRHFRSKVEQLINKKKPFVIAMVDVDYFKNYNDTHGHPAGDVVLRTLGQLLNHSVREEDVFARYGGEEFIICFSHVNNVETAARIAERFRQNVEEYKFYREETQPTGNLTISIGLSGPSYNKGLDELIDEADQALYKAKRTGRNCVET
ncbi:diguanylate cyclase [Mesobacillus persicus]|uniref:Diguanylate cyclase n=1 Tax=Mesobacillus persicus TaxID=930146 RepID=A0A1H8IT27_9BACI|nr:diguanylate cyclase [Mesobacillus persicus]SEN71146.1 diguanylate cyclase [Mesobacillus persicus]